MTPKFYDLCSTLVEDCYGEFYGLLFRQLSRYGRLSSTQLAQKCHLPLRQVRSGLAALIQLRLVYYHESTIQDVTTYQANLKSAYNILRTGKLINLANRILGQNAASVMRTICDLGFATAAEVKARIVQNTTRQSNHNDKLENTIRELLNHNFLERVRSIQFQSDFDARNDVERDLKDSGTLPKSTGLKARTELEEKIETELRNRSTTTTSEFGHVNQSYERAFNLNGDGLKSAHHDEILLNGNHDFSALLIRPNYQKVVSVIRSEYLYEAAKSRIGSRPGLILQSLVDQGDTGDFNQFQTDPIHIVDLDKLQDEVNEKLTTDEFQDVEPNSGAINGNHRFASGMLFEKDIDKSLTMLMESSFDFVNGGENFSNWTLNRHELQNFVRRKEMLRLMESRIERPSPRILRMLMEKGKVEEKTLQEIGLLGAKELRQSLAQLKQMGYVDLQEVPRDPQRQPNRTLFLWFYDAERVQNTILESIYIAMTRLLERLKLERENMSNTLNKVEREDVKDRVEEILPPAELDELYRFRRLEDWFIVEMNRLDDSIALLCGN